MADVGEIKRRLRAMANALRFDGTVDGRIVDIGTKCLGRDLRAAAATGIEGQCLANQAAPDGSAWKANQGRYGEVKRKIGLPVGIGVKRKGGSTAGRRMLSDAEIQGKAEISDEGRKLVMRYGTSDEVRRKGRWFTAGSEGADGCEPSGAKNQPARKFYGLNATLKAELVGLARAHVREALRRLRSGS